MDDGTVARLADDLYYVTTTSTGADAVTAWFEWWNAVWGYDAEIVNVTGALAALNLAGPRAREALGRLVEDADDVSAEDFRYLDAHAARGRRRPAAWRCGSGSSASSGTSSTSRARPREHLWDAPARGGRAAVRARAAARPPAGEGTRDRRPGHRLGVQPATRRGCPGSRRWTRTTSSASSRSSTSRERDAREVLVGFTMEEDVVPAEGAQIVVEGLPAGRVTSARRSEQVGQVIGLAWLPPDRAEGGTRFEIRVDRRLLGAARVHARRVLRPDRGADARVSGLDFLSPARLRRRRRSRRRSRARSTAPTRGSCAISRLDGQGRDPRRPRACSRPARARSSSGSRRDAASCLRRRPARCRRTRARGRRRAHTT